jgi:hypothetical protein
MRKILLGASIVAAAVAVSLGLAPAAAQAAGAPCMVWINFSSGPVIEWYEDGDIIQTDDGDIVCRNGVWEGPNVDSPMPGGGGGTVLA